MRHFNEDIAGLAGGQGADGNDGLIDEFLGFAAGVTNGIAGAKQLPHAFDTVVFARFEEIDEQFAVLRRGVFEEVNHRKRQLAFFNIGPKRLADGFLLAADIEDVVDDLEGQSELFPVGGKRVDPRFAWGGSHGAQAAAVFGEDGGFAVDDLIVGFFVELPVAAVGVLGQFAFAYQIGGVADEAAGLLAVEA